MYSVYDIMQYKLKIYNDVILFIRDIIINNKNIELKVLKKIILEKIDQSRFLFDKFYINELLNLTNKPNFRYLAGGTDLNLQRPIINEDQNTIINLSNIKELKNIEVQNNKLLLGSAVTI